MIWAKADPLRKVHQLSDHHGGDPDDEKECAAEIAVRLGDTEIFNMLKIAPTKERAYFYRGEPKLVVEVIRLLDVADACKKALLRELIDKPKMRAWVGFHEPDLRERLLATAPEEESMQIVDS